MIPSSDNIIGESSHFNAMADKCVIAIIHCGHLLSYFEKSQVDREVINAEKQSNNPIIGSAKLFMKNRFYNSMDNNFMHI